MEKVSFCVISLKKRYLFIVECESISHQISNLLISLITNILSIAIKSQIILQASFNSCKCMFILDWEEEEAWKLLKKRVESKIKMWSKRWSRFFSLSFVSFRVLAHVIACNRFASIYHQTYRVRYKYEQWRNRDDDDALLSQLGLLRLCHRSGRREEKYHYRNCSPRLSIYLTLL